MNKCPKCGREVELPNEPHNPTPCPDCGTQVYPELNPGKRQNYPKIGELPEINEEHITCPECESSKHVHIYGYDGYSGVICSCRNPNCSKDSVWVVEE